MMDEVEAKVVFTKETKDKSKEVYSTLINRVHKYFVLDNKEARIDTVISLLSTLAMVVGIDRCSEIPSDSSYIMEVDKI